MYAQDINEPHASSGVYSIKDDKWLEKPNKFRKEFDKTNVSRKVKYFKRLIDMEIEEAKMNRNIKGLEKLIKKIRDMRSAGLEKSGEMADENIIYKVLRGEGDIQKLYDMKDNIFDVDLSLWLILIYIPSISYPLRSKILYIKSKFELAISPSAGLVKS